MKEKQARTEDALHSTRAAVEEGLVAGGGVALVRALQKIEGLTGDNESEAEARSSRSGFDRSGGEGSGGGSGGGGSGGGGGSY